MVAENPYTPPSASSPVISPVSHPSYLPLLKSHLFPCHPQTDNGNKSNVPVCLPSVMIEPSPGPTLTPATSLIKKVKRSLRLGNGTLISFTEDDVPDPPVLSFSDHANIPFLNRMWDDTSEYWDGQSKLIIHGQPIAIIYWPEVYAYSKKGQWKGVKGNWFNWKVGCIVYSHFHLPFTYFSCSGDY